MMKVVVLSGRLLFTALFLLTCIWSSSLFTASILPDKEEDVRGQNEDGRRLTNQGHETVKPSFLIPSQLKPP